MEKKFKTFDRVLTKYGKVWVADIYSNYIEENKLHLTLRGTFYDTDILHYEGNEHLVGTSDSPDEEVKLEEGEWLMCAAGPYDTPTYWILIQFNKTREAKFIGANGGDWSYAIRFSDFNPNDMEATKAKILCIKGGKIVRYKG